MKIQRSWATPITIGGFLLSGITGVLMFFHLDSGLNKLAHEWLGLVLIAGVILHVTANFPGFKSHLATLRGRLLIGVFAVVLLASFVPLGNKGDGPPFMRPMRALSQAPLTALAQVAKITPEELRARLSKAGLHPASDDQSVSSLVGPDQKKQMRVLGIVFAENG